MPHSSMPAREGRIGRTIGEIRCLASASLLPMLAGLLIGTSYIPFPPWALFFCLSPLFVAWARGPSERKAAWDGWLAQFILNMIGFHWVARTAYEFGHLPRPLAIITLILFCATAHLHYPAAGWAARRLTRSWRRESAGGLEGAPLAAFVGLAAALLLFFESVFPAIFPWHLGYPWLWAGWPGFQTADVIGFEGINVATVATNALIAIAWLERKRVARAAAFAAAAFALVAALNVGGRGRGDAWRIGDAELRVLAVQGNVGNFEKLYAQKGMRYQSEVIGRYFRLTREGLARLPGADVVLWPETAFPDNLDRPFLERPNPRALRDFAREIGRPIVTGAYSEEAGKKLYFNGLFAFGPDGDSIQDGYRKTILLAFGEYVPLSRFFPWIFDLVPTISSFGRGHGPIALPVAGTKIGPQICYEGLYPEFSAGLAAAGAEVIFNVTNDSWFGDDFEPRQHLFMTLARAIETRRPLMRATNTGITTAILASGEILEMSPQNQEWSGLFRIPYRRSPPSTPYQRIESAFPYFWPCALALAAALLLGFGHARARQTFRQSESKSKPDAG